MKREVGRKDRKNKAVSLEKVGACLKDLNNIDKREEIGEEIGAEIGAEIGTMRGLVNDLR